jgi:peptidoglycan pentaglycine glycine transferase (the first glycine)
MLRELTIGDRPHWDAFVQAQPAGCFMQSWGWSNFKALEGYKTWRYGVFIQGELVGGCIFYWYPRHHSANLLVAPGGPVFAPDYAPECLPVLLAQAAKLAEDNGAIALRIEPLLTPAEFALAANPSFVRAPVDLLPSETLLIDLHPDPTAILAAMKPKGRYNIRLSQRHGVVTQFTTDPQAIPQFYDIFWETVERQQFFGEPYRFFINLCRTLFVENMAEIGLATWHDQTLAVLVLVYWGDRATYLYGGHCPDQPQVMANYGLHWAAMQRAKARGCRWYDFYGFTRDPKHNYAQFSRFKGQFGGTVVTTIGAQDYFFYDRLADTLIDLLKKSLT